MGDAWTESDWCSWNAMGIAEGQPLETNMLPRRALLLLPALIFSGCATSERVWVKPDASNQDFHMDRGQCIAQAYGAAAANPYAAAPPMSAAAGQLSVQRAYIFAGCMQGRGWSSEVRPIQR